MSRPIRLTHLIVRLDTGGAEKSLFRLIKGTQSDIHHTVICLGPRSAIGADIEALGVVVHWLDYRKKGPWVLWQAGLLLKNDLPDILQGWMYLGNVLASMLAAALPKSFKVAWNIRNSPEDFSKEGWATRTSVFIARYFHPNLIIYNSHAGYDTHDHFGFNRSPWVVIPNGIDLSTYQPSQAVRERVRAEYGLGDEPWVAVVTRYHPAKGIPDFLAAIAQLKKDGLSARYALVGPGMNKDNDELVVGLSDCGLTDQDVELLGPIPESAEFLPALDMLVLCSYREGSPNILIEALACGVNAVASKVGDVPRIMLDNSRQFEPGDVHGLVRGISEHLQDVDKAQRVQQERAHLAANFAIDRCLATYLDRYGSLVA